LARRSEISHDGGSGLAALRRDSPLTSPPETIDGQAPSGPLVTATPADAELTRGQPPRDSRSGRPKNLGPGSPDNPKTF
jgi:hypothetical protein